MLGNFAWYQILAGNLLAAALTGTYLWRSHPALKHRLVSALEGTPDYVFLGPFGVTIPRSDNALERFLLELVSS